MGVDTVVRDLAVAAVLGVTVTCTLAALAVVLLARGAYRAGRRLRARSGFLGCGPWYDAGRRAPRYRYGADGRAATLAALSSTLGSPQWWDRQRQRQAMWRAVTSAERAVRAARRSGANVGELPRLTRLVHASARAVDAALDAAGPDAQLRHDLRERCAEVERAASDIRRAAAEAALATVDATPSLVAAVRDEVDALAAGLRAAARASRPTLR